MNKISNSSCGHLIYAVQKLQLYVEKSKTWKILFYQPIDLGGCLSTSTNNGDNKMSDFKIKDLMVPVFPNSNEMQGEIGACPLDSCTNCTCTRTNTFIQTPDDPQPPEGPSFDMSALKADLAELEAKQ